MIRISAGLACITLCVLFAANALGLVPDRVGAVVEGRKRLAEALALQFSHSVQQADVAAILGTIREMQRRDPDLEWARVRKADGKMLLELGRKPEEVDESKPNVNHLRIPLTLRREPWGAVDLAFKPVEASGIAALLGGPILYLAIFVTICCFLGTAAYLRTVLRHVHQSESGVMPHRVQATLNTIAEGVLVLDKNQRIALANDAFASRFGKPPEYLKGRKASDLPWRRRKLDELAEEFPWVKALQYRKPETGSILELSTPNAGLLKLSVNSTPIVTDDGDCKGALATFDDLTPIESKNAELLRVLRRLNTSRSKIRRQKKDLERAKAAAEAANRAKSNFLANVSHEIRTPMNAIIGLTEVTLDMKLAPEQREYLELVKTSADNLLAVINEILDFAKIESGKFQLDPIEFHLRDCVVDSLKLLAVRAQKKALELLCDIPSDVPDLLVGDPGRLRQVIINLVGNAIKFASRGDIVVRIEIQAQTQEELVLHFSVSDQGIGIPADKLRTIFDPFEQADTSTTRQFGGTGLGLAISSQLVQLMDGKIWVESEVGQGSTFHFTASFAPTDSPASSTAPDAHLREFRVLVVDDNPTACRIVRNALTDLGCLVDTVHDEPSANALMALALQTGSKFSLHLLDAELPGVDRLAKVIEERTPDARIVILLSSPDQQEQKIRGRQLGARSFLTKQCKPEDVRQALYRALGIAEAEDRADADVGATAAAAIETQRALRILLVDDNLFNQKVGLAKIGGRGHAVRIAGSGKEALDALEQSAFDLVLMDMQMPDMDGLEVAARIRNKEKETGQHLPIIALTAHAGADVQQKCLAGGMDGYVSKPIRDHELWTAISTLLSEATPAQPPHGEQPQDNQHLDNQQVLDQHAILERVGGNLDLLRDLIAVFRQNSSSLLDDIDRALRASDGKGVSAAAHTLKGMVSFFGSTPIIHTTVELEALGREGDLSQVPSLLVKLTADINMLHHNLFRQFGTCTTLATAED